MAYTVIIPAAGTGKRMGAGKNKLFIQLGHQPLIIHTLQVFQKDEACRCIIVVANEHEKSDMQRLFSKYRITKIKEMVAGGRERQESVHAGLECVDDEETVLIHDGARPFVRKTEIDQLLPHLSPSQGAVLATPVKDTIKRAIGPMIAETLEREGLWALQTPQAFPAQLLKRAYAYAHARSYTGTDDASLVEYYGGKVRLVLGNEENIKLTTPYDRQIGEFILMKRREEEKHEDRTRV